MRVRGVLTAIRGALDRRAVLIVLVLLAGVWGARETIPSQLGPTPGFDWQKHCDVAALWRGLREIDGPAGTLKWWVGPWVLGTPYWRPLTSYGFLAMVEVFGWPNFGWFDVVTVACHVVVALLLFLFAEEVSGSALVGLGAVAVNNALSPWFTDPIVVSPGIHPVDWWMSIPDIWLAMAVLPALMLAWRGRLWWALFLTAMAAMVKETGFLAFPAAMALYWWRHRRWHHAMLGLLLVGGLLAVVKMFFVGPGSIIGSNLAIWHRMFRFVGARPGALLIAATSPYAVLGIGVGAAIITRRRTALSLAFLTGGLLAFGLTFWGTRTLPGDVRPGLDVIIAGLMLPDMVDVVLGMALWIVLAWAGLTGPWRSTIVAMVVSWLLLGLPGTIAPQAGQRSFYTAWLLSATLTSLCLASLPQMFTEFSRPDDGG